MEPARQVAGAWQALAGAQIVAQDSENNLRYQLFAESDRALVSEPELHAAAF